MTLLYRLVARVRVIGDCWVWVGAASQWGYPMVRIADKCEYVHRVMHEQAHGPVPAGYMVDHLCRNTRCINPDHLEAVTKRENTLRGTSTAAVHAKKTHCDHGHPFDAGNTYIRRDTGGRMCRTCGRQRALAKYHRLRAQIAVAS